ncbi:MAG: DEAD/DEAH box helicase family protein [Glaciecola sp.]|nr:DEAD/DEAH box helicase family protein [Glaciecola sp.]
MKKIYIYETPTSKLESLIKIGDAIDIDKRIDRQLNTASSFQKENLEYTLLYQTEAIKEDGTLFRDHDVHAVLEYKGYPKRKITKDNEVLKSNTEWFKVDVNKVIHLIEQFKAGKKQEEIEIERFQDFPMRPEQLDAVNRSKAFLSQTRTAGETLEMLWNAKMRFGKTFTAYQLALSMSWKKVLVLTYKPAVEDAWKKDLEHHVDFKDYVFLRRDTLSEITDYLDKSIRVVAFASYQDLLGDSSEGSIKARHEDLFNTHWDAVIIDEFHYGAGTKKAKDMMAEHIAIESNSEPTDKQLEQAKKEFFSEEDDELSEEKETEAIVEVVEKAITSDSRLYLSGTPFKAIANAQFPHEAIYNWTYTDEQKAKEKWALENPLTPEGNPYLSLPQIQMYLYKVSDDLIQAGVDEGKNEFSLNHFFKAKNKKFLNELAVKKWLDLISGIIRPHVEIDEEIMDEKRLVASQYPFDHDSKLFDELDHTLWYLNRVDSAYALKAMLEAHPVFQHFHIILAAGKELKSGVDAVQPVLDAIDNNKRTITISVGKLTTGVSIPKWKGVMFLRDIASPENYFQTAFRAQTPYKNPITREMKSVCYVFDFSPNRSLRLLTTYSEKLSTDTHLTTSEEKLGEFIRYLPVLKVAGNSMVSMEAREVLIFDLSGIDAKGLGERFIERKNVVVNRDTINAINATEQTQQRVQDIFDRIKMFKKFNGASDNEMKQSDVDVGNLDVNDKKIKNLETKDTTEKEKKKTDKEINEAEKEMKSEREKIRELLRTLLSRLPIFMYLTDATEENIEQVLIEDKHDLFRKTTGIQVDDFRYLVDIGLLRVESIDGYILKFVNLESANYNINNQLISQ